MLEERLVRTKSLIEEKLGALDRPAVRIMGALDRELRLLSMHTSLQNYSDFFLDLAQRKQVQLTGDITPAYSMLEASHFAKVKQALVKNGFTVRVVFLMRDPVVRILSAMSMARRTMSESKRAQVPNFDDFVLRHYQDWETEMRTRYDRTILALEEVFTPEELFFDFYERLFKVETIKSLCDFIGLDYQEPDFGKRVNAAPKSAQASDATMALIRNHYDETYRFCADRFGAQTMADLWPQHPAQ